MSDELHLERLIAHRELQLLRAAAWQPRKGQERRKRRWVAERVRKFDQALQQRARAP